MSVNDTLPDWMGLPGTTLEGGYELKEIVEAAGEHAVLRVRVLGDYTMKASASFYVGGRPAAEEQVSVWQTLRSLDNKANLSVPLGSGILTLNSVTLAYLVFETADETLGEVLAQRALQSDEATDLVRAIGRGAGELHSNGFVHGYLAPKEVLAVRDNVQLSTECIRRVNTDPLFERKAAKYLAPESGARNLTIASDVWCLGATMFEALTQKEYQPELREEAAGLKHPLGTLINSCLDPNPDERCKLDDLEKILRSKAPILMKPKPALASVEPEPNPRVVVFPAASPAPVTPVPITPRPAPPARVEASSRSVPERPAEKRALSTNEPPPGRKLPNELSARPSIVRNEARGAVEELPSSGSRNRGWIYAIAAFAVIFAILWVVRSRSQSRNPVTTAAVDKQADPPKPAPGTAWPTTTLTPDAKAPAAAAKSTTDTSTAKRLSHAAKEEPSRAQPADAQPRTIWRVVLYTYSREQDAQNKAREIGEKRSDLHPEVFAAGDSGGPYLVVAGGRMNREAAARLRQRAVREGMPHDTYIQNYSR